MSQITNRMHCLVGSHVYVQALPGLRFRCRIVNVKSRYVEIEAIEGQGKGWVPARLIEPCYPPNGGPHNA